MFLIPNSSAMDATASSGGPGTFVGTIATGSPEQIAVLAAQRLRQAEQFLQIIEQLNGATQQLSTAWSGSASQAAVQKITSTVAAFQKIVKVIQTGSALLGTSGTLVKSAQAGYTAVVSSVNPTVASLMSSPWTYGAATALSTAASSSLRAYITGVQAVLQGLGSGQLMQQVAMVMKVIQEIQQLSGGASASSSAGSVASLASVPSPATQAVAGTVSQPAAAAGQGPVAQSNLNAFTNYTPAVLSGHLGSAAATPQPAQPA
jgi:uncharacterized protein YukE